MHSYENASITEPASPLSHPSPAPSYDVSSRRPSAGPIISLVSLLAVIVGIIIGSGIYLVLKNNNGKLHGFNDTYLSELGVPATFGNAQQSIPNLLLPPNSLLKFPVCSLSTIINDATESYNLTPADKKTNTFFVNRFQKVLTDRLDTPTAVSSIQACAYFPYGQKIDQFTDAVVVYKIIWDREQEGDVNLTVSHSSTSYISGRPVAVWSTTNDDGTEKCSALIDSQIVVEIYPGHGGHCVPPRSIAAIILGKGQ